ncbi:hypothetical protein ACIBCM_32415 [Streptomyces sp. NPDC051018]|uniref:hypothetical protein n=1 Tax=Streptomyces sp. NPDC051018 TaxID=3365639 RepID=UPI00378B44D1
MTVRQRRRLARGLVAASGVLMAAMAVGWWSSWSGGLLMVAQVLHHPLLFGLSVVAALTAAVFLGVRNVVIRVLSAVTAGLIAFFAVPLALFASSGQEVTTDEAAPGRSDRRLVVEEGADLIDPLWWVYVDEGSGLAKRRWQVGYFNGDVGANVLVEAAWEGPDRIRLVTGEEEEARVHLVDLRPGTGEPLRTISMD